MRKESRMLLKLTGILFGIVLLLVCMLSGIRMAAELDERAQAIDCGEAAVLFRALCEEAGAVTYEEPLRELERQREEKLRYEELHRLAQTLPPQAAESVEAKNGLVGRAAFYRLYFDMVEALSLEEVICRRELFALEVTPERVMTEQGSFDNRAGADRKALFCTLSGVVRGPELLAVESVRETDGYTLRNVWLMEKEGQALTCFRNGEEFTVELPRTLAEEEQIRREQVADISFADGAVERVVCKTEKVHGRILSVGDNMIELEGVGTLFLQEDMQIYKLYGTLECYDVSKLKVGYAFTDFVLEDGKVAAGLVTQDETMERIRVLIQAGNYSGIFHETVSLTCDSDYELACGGKKEVKKAGEITEITADSPRLEEKGRVTVTPCALTGRIRLNSVQRSRGAPEYRGVMEIVQNSDGIFVINELLLEEYLYAVVPSEMPASYAPEALKAQAVCARTYAYRKMERAGLAAYGAHVDDSTTYQVYNNILENAETTRAVKETRGELLYAGGEPADTYYYSTSCGYGTDGTVWSGGADGGLPYLVPRHIAPQENETQGAAAQTEAEAAAVQNEAEDTAVQNETQNTAVQTGAEVRAMEEEAVFAQYINGVNREDYESNQAWYRWSYEVEAMDVLELQERLRARYAQNPKLILTKEGESYVSKEIGEPGALTDIRVEKRGPGGIISELVLTWEKDEVKVITEHNVRYVLCSAVQSEVVRQDGSRAAVSSLLPSSFFVIYPSKEDGSVIGYRIVGGGFGHGVGMSQNGAKGMAEAGLDYRRILTFFYSGSSIENIYEGTAQGEA